MHSQMTDGTSTPQLPKQAAGGRMDFYCQIRGSLQPFLMGRIRQVPIPDPYGYLTDLYPVSTQTVSYRFGKSQKYPLCRLHIRHIIRGCRAVPITLICRRLCKHQGKIDAIFASSLLVDIPILTVNPSSSRTRSLICTAVSSGVPNR